MFVNPGLEGLVVIANAYDMRNNAERGRSFQSKSEFLSEQS